MTAVPNPNQRQLSMTHPPLLLRALYLGGAFLFLSIPIAHAGSATWSGNPTTDDWNTAANWMPNTVPNGAADIATFASSALTNVSLSSGVEVRGIVFNPGASSFTINIDPPVQEFQLSIGGAGITNNSGVAQHFVTADDAGGALGEIIFGDNATAGSLTTFTNKGGVLGGSFGAGGGIFFQGSNATAGHATFTNNAGAVVGAGGGFINFLSTSTAGDGTFTNDGAAVSGAGAGSVSFLSPSSGGNATIINNGGTVSGAAGGKTTFLGGNGGSTSTAANATLIANGGINGGAGGVIALTGRTQNGGKARVELFGNGTLEIDGHQAPGVTIGSIEGDGIALAGANRLTVGKNNLDTMFSGMIRESPVGAGGALAKIGKGTLTLGSANEYSGGTTLSGGTLLIQNTTRSATGRGPVQVTTGTLGGVGKMDGTVTIGTGTSSGAILLAGNSANSPGILTINNALTFQSLSTYKCVLKRATATASKITALGVTINSNATFTFVDTGTGSLATGTVFTVISNTSSAPIVGAFSNLPDGSVFTSKGNNFQVSYTGGTGNDLTLTVVP